MYGAGQQIANYSASARRGGRRTKSDPTKTESKRAAKVAMGKTRSSARRPSLEGYSHAPSATIHMNDTGYLNKANQTARRTLSPRDQAIRDSNIQAGDRPHAMQTFETKRTTDYTRRGQPGSSMRMLRDRTTMGGSLR